MQQSWFSVRKQWATFHTYCVQCGSKAQFRKRSWNRQCRNGHSGNDLAHFCPITIKYWFIMVTSRYDCAIVDRNCFGIWPHHNDVIMGAMASQITSLTIVYSTVYSDSDKKKTSKLLVTGLSAGNSTQMASKAENVSIWRHYETRQYRSDYCPVYLVLVWRCLFPYLL